MSVNTGNRYKCKLSPEVLEKAVKDVNEPANDDERLQKIDELRNAFNSQSEETLQLTVDDDSHVLCFLRAKKFSQIEALNLMKSYHARHIAWPEVYYLVKNLASVKHVFDAGCFVFYNSFAVDGSAVLIGRPGKIEKPLLTEFVAAATLSIEHLLKDEKYQVYGMSLVQDCAYFRKMGQQMGPLAGRKMMNWIHNSIPIRVASVNFVNEPKLMDSVVSIFRLFVKEDVKKRIKFFGSDFDKLHKVIERSSLPPLYNGTGPDLDDIIERWKKVVYNDDVV